MVERPTDTPANISEFNQIVGLVFAQLYVKFPVATDLDRRAISAPFGVLGNQWGSHLLASGRRFSDVLAGTIGWLKHEGYIASFGLIPTEQVLLTEKGLAALNAVPKGLSATLGSSLVEATNKPEKNWSNVGDLVGGVIGGFTKSITGG